MRSSRGGLTVKNGFLHSNSVWSEISAEMSGSEDGDCDDNSLLGYIAV
jgi:hypothetical protein